MSNIEELIGEAQSRAEDTDLEESIASLVTSRKQSVSHQPMEKQTVLLEELEQEPHS